MDNTTDDDEKGRGYIPGIYNYCDRWCERCRFTARCHVYAMEDEDDGDDRAMDVTSDPLWNKISESLQSTLNLIAEIASEEGIDLDAVESAEPDEGTDVVHILSGISGAYIDRVDGWFAANARLVENGLRNCSDHPHLKLVRPEGDEAPMALEDAVRVIQWYAHPIHVKLSRALRSKKDEKKFEFDDFPKDSDGSAKVALIGMDCSIRAWGELLNCFKSRRREILEIVRYLKRIRDITEKEFPGARSFVRPGFDEAEFSPAK